MSAEALVQLVQDIERPLRVTRLDLKGWNLGKSDPCLLGSLVLRCPKLRQLSLAQNGLADEAAFSLAPCLKFLQDNYGGQLAELDLHGNLLTPDGCEAIARNFFPDLAVQQQQSQATATAAEPSSYTLDLSENPGLGDAGAAVLAVELKTNGCLGSLRLRRAGISSAGFASLAAAADCLVHLDLAHNAVASAVELGPFFAALGAAPSLRALDLSEVLPTGPDAQDLAERLVGLLARALRCSQSRMRRLALAGNGIGAAGAQLLVEAARSGGSRLEELDLARNHLGDAWKSAEVRALAELLSWREAAPPEAALEPAEPFQGLGVCCLCGNDLDDTAVALLAEGLRQSVGLEVLRLSQNAIHDRGAVCLAEALKAQRAFLGRLQEPLRQGSGDPEQVHGAPRRCGVIDLWLSHNPIGDAGLEALAEAATSVAPELESLWGPWGLAELHIAGHSAGSRGLAAVRQAKQARTGLLKLLLSELSEHKLVREGGGAPPFLLCVDELPLPDAEDVALEASLARYWAESFGAAAWAVRRRADGDGNGGSKGGDEDGLTLEEELRMAVAEREGEERKKDVHAANLASSEDPEMVALSPEDANQGSPSAWLSRFSVRKLFADENAPDALDDWYNDDGEPSPRGAARAD